jgi:hypothetical protein
VHSLCTIAALGAASLALAASAAPTSVSPQRATIEVTDAATARPRATGAGVPLVNPSFESSKRGIGGGPEGWVAIQHAGPLSYTFNPDSSVRRGGAASVRIDNVGPEPFGAIFQQIPALALRGRSLRLVGWIKTRDVSGSATGGGAVLMLQAMKGGAVIAYDHMRDNPLKGTTDWTRREITLAIPAAAEQIELGAMLHGPGSLWLDDVEIEILPPR